MVTPIVPSSPFRRQALRRSRFAFTVAGALAAALPASAATFLDWTDGGYAAKGLPSPLGPDATIFAFGQGNKDFVALDLTIDGALHWQTGARMGFVNATLRNNGLVELEDDARLVRIATGVARFHNNAGGIFRKSAGTGTSVVAETIQFINAGTIDVQSGTIDFGNDAGTADGAATFDSGTRFTGSGRARVSANTAFNGMISSTSLELALGRFTGNSAVLSGTTAWTGGQLVGSWQLAAGQTLTASGAGNKDFSTASFTNAGTLIWATSARMGFINSAVTNTGLVDVQADANLSHAGGVNPSTVVNEGVFRKSGGSGSTVIGDNVAFTNPGTIEALSGTIVLPANFTNPGTIKGTATVQTNTLTNTGTIAPGASPGTLALTGNLVMSATGSLDIEIESTSLHDVLAVSGSALLDGTLVVRRYGDYAPRVGDSFTILTYGSRVGQSEFDALSTLGFGSGVLFDVSYGANAVTLSVAAVPEPETYALMAVGLGMVAWAARRRQRKIAPAA